jgi:hypothetical protein
MRQLRIATILGLGVVLSAGALPASAQISGIPGGYRPPASYGSVTSPAYPAALNLLRAGNPLYANYYGLVRPELEFRRYIGNLQTQTATNQQNISNLETQGIPGTGHGTQLLNTSHYFFYRGTQTSAGRTAPPPQPQQQPQVQRYQAPPSRRQ